MSGGKRAETLRLSREGRDKTAGLPPKLWSPRLVLQEARPAMTIKCNEFLNRQDVGAKPGDMYALTLYDGPIDNKMDLHLFPFDTDTIALTFRGCQCMMRDGEIGVQYKSDYRLFIGVEHCKYGVWGSAEVDIPDWQYVGTKVEYKDLDEPQDLFEIGISLTRNTQFYVYKVIVPLLLITLLNFLVFFVPIDSLADRLAHNTTLFLSAFALLYVIGADLPKTNYQTPIDRVILATILMLALTGVHAVVVHQMATTEDDDTGLPDPDSVALAQDVDNYMLIALGGFFCVFLMYEFVPTYMKKKIEIAKIRNPKQKTYEQLAKEEKEREKIKGKKYVAKKKKKHAKKEARKCLHEAGVQAHKKKITGDLSYRVPWWLKHRVLVKAAGRPPKLVLVPRDSVHRCVFAHADKLREGGDAAVPLTLTSHPGLVVAELYGASKEVECWRYIELGLRPEAEVAAGGGEHGGQAIEVRRDGGFLERPEDRFVFDVCMWSYKQGIHLNILEGFGNDGTHDVGKTRASKKGGGGREFIVNEDGTIGCQAAPEFVFGSEFAPDGWKAPAPAKAKGPKNRKETKRKEETKGAAGDGDGLEQGGADAQAEAKAKEERLEIARQRRANAEAAAAANPDAQQGTTEEA